MKPFASRLLHWFDRHGRHDLPWQHPRTPYRVWLAEIMLQQTQVATVIPYYRRFLERFPSIARLARAPLDDVLAHWAGLGYYARARNLHRAAQVIAEQHGGRFPRDFAAVSDLPGIGRSTAGAILAQAFGQRHAILDGNARRVFARHAGVRGWPGAPATSDGLWRYAEKQLPRARLTDYTQALMDLGATLCTSRAPRCDECPVRGDCVALRRNLVDAIPAPRPAKARPQKSARLLLIENARGELLLERRPAQGIWGGLWCPPVVAHADKIARHHGMPLKPLGVLPAFRHSFTHYDFDLQPLRFRVAEAAPLGEDDAWVKLSRLAQLGLPAPIRKLLSS